MNRFENKVVVITGAAGGIGEATTRRIVSEGGKVVIADQGGIIHLHTVWKRYPADTDNRGNLSPGRWLCRCCGASLEGRRGCRGSSHGAWVSGEFIPFSTDQ